MFSHMTADQLKEAMLQLLKMLADYPTHNSARLVQNSCRFFGGNVN
jgi:hypothetical protein